MSINQELSSLFLTLSAIMEIKGENVFKALAFQKVGRILKDMPVDIRQIAAEGKLDEVEGIGAHSRKIIDDYLQSGHSPDYDELAASVPAGLLALLQIPGLGPKTLALFWKERNITNLEELIQAIDRGELAGLRGIGQKKIDAIRQGIALRAQAGQRMGIAEALPVAGALLMRLRGLPQVKQAEAAGSLRRWRETVGDLDLVCSLKDAEDGAAVAEAFVTFPEVERVLVKGTTKTSVVTAGGLQVDLRLVPPENFGAALLYFTGSKDHNVKIRTLAQRKNLTLNEWGLYKVEEYEKIEKKPAEAPAIHAVASKTETDVYRHLGMPFIPPELREDRGEVEAAMAHHLPKLIELKDIRGDLHTHTTASDGIGSIEQMAEAAMARGYEYLAITDHSRSQIIANGLTVQRLLKHAEEIRKISGRLKGITLLAGAEVDILADGHLDYEDAVLAELDIVVASPHVALKQPPEKATDRLLRAIENPHVHVIGHPTGRLINAREGLPLDWARICKAAADNAVALEINAGYPRLDLNDMQARAAIEAGVWLSINTDAHGPRDFEWILMGLGVARRGWVQAKNVINCLPLKELRASFLHHKRRHK